MSVSRRWLSGGLVMAALLAGCTAKSVAGEDGEIQVVGVRPDRCRLRTELAQRQGRSHHVPVCNQDAGGVTELEVLSEERRPRPGGGPERGTGHRVVVLVDLERRSYQTYCPGGTKDRGTLEVAESDTG